MTTVPASSPATATTTVRSAGAGRTVLVLLAAFVVAGIATSIIAAVGTALGAGFPPLTPAVYLPFVAVGLVAAYVGWRIVRARVARPFAVLRVLVPVLLVLSFVPDISLMILGFIPGASVLGAVSLMLMHLVVVGVAVPVAQRLLPVSAATDRP